MKKIEVKAVADKRIFCLYAALNAVGYNDENAKAMHPVRLQVREWVAQRQPDISQLKELLNAYPQNWYYKFRRWILNHGEPPAFEVLRDRAGQEDFSGLADFGELLGKFWKVADLETAWQKVLPEYQLAVDEAHKNGVKAAEQVTNYLKMADLGIDRGVIIPNLIDSYNRGIGPKVGRVAFVILGPSDVGMSIPRIQHEMLHSIINPLTGSYSPKLRSRLREYLIRAAVLRMNSVNNEYYTSRREKHIRQGYGQIDQWLDWLKRFELGDQPFDQYLQNIEHPSID